MRCLAVCILLAACRYDGMGTGPDDPTEAVDAEVDAVDAAPVDAAPPDVMLALACGDVPIGGCSEEQCITDPFDPGYGSCGGDLYACDPTVGEWERVGECEPRPLDVHGGWSLDLVPLDPACDDEIALPDHLELIADHGIEPYVVYIPGDDRFEADFVNVMEGFYAGTSASVTFFAPQTFLTFDLEFDWHHDIVGTVRLATAPACQQEATVSGKLSPFPR